MKHKFGSPNWCARLKSAFEEAASNRLTDELSLEYTLCEVYLEAPDNLGAVDGNIAWHVKFHPSGADWAYGEAPDADILIRGRYVEMSELGRVLIEGDPDKRKAMDDLIRAARKGGHLTYANKLPVQPTFTAGVHDIMARVTL